MAYNATYSASDVAPAVISGLTVYIITLVAFAGVLALIIAWRYVKKNAR